MNIDPRAKGDSGPEVWYYRLDGREHGPMSLAVLEELVASSGEIVTDVEVREGPPSGPLRVVANIEAIVGALYWAMITAAMVRQITRR
jgi:hypothetical protein